MKHTLEITDLSGIDSAAREFLGATEGRSIIAFYGSMGAGKTTFTTAICRALGVESDAVSSPTFAIVNEYRAAGGKNIFHFDFYRIKNLAEAMDIGFYDYIDSGEFCIMEWPENVEELLPEETLRVKIEVSQDSRRIITWED